MVSDLSAPVLGGKNAGKYRVLKRLAVGGMAEIYLARVTGIEGFQKHVVLKRIRPVHAEDPRFVEMFLDEARLAALLHHQNIAQVYDIGQLDGGYFFSMEFLHGQDVQSILKRMVKRRERVPLEYALTIVAGAAAGLHYAHEKSGPSGEALNIVHRDVSPSNIVVTYDGGVKVVDFGIARAAQRESPETRSGTLKGKISYMSPEQCRGEEMDRRSDIFSLGIVLYETTTTSRLFRKGKNADFIVMQRIVSGDIQPPSERVDGYPPELERVVMRALAPRPEDRYQTARDMLFELENVAASLRLPLSQARLSAFIESTFGRPPEPWHIEGEAIDEDPPDVGHTVSTTAAPFTEPQIIEELSSISISIEGHDPRADLETKSTVVSGRRRAIAAESVDADGQAQSVRPGRKRMWLLALAGVAVVAVVAVFALRGGSSGEPAGASQGEADRTTKEATDTKTEQPPVPPPDDRVKVKAKTEAKPEAKAETDTGANTRTETKAGPVTGDETKTDTAPNAAAASKKKPAVERRKRRAVQTRRVRRRKPRPKKKKKKKKKKKDSLIDTTW